MDKMSPYDYMPLLSPYKDRAYSVEQHKPVEITMRTIQTSKGFGAAVRHARKAQGLSQVELAARAGVGRPWLSELETGKRTVELGRALSVLSALDLAVTFVPTPAPDRSRADLSQIIGV